MEDVKPSTATDPVSPGPSVDGPTLEALPAPIEPEPINSKPIEPEATPAPFAEVAPPAPPEGPSVHDGDDLVDSTPELDFDDDEPVRPEYPIGSVELAKANSLSPVNAAAYANHFREQRAAGVAQDEAHQAAVKKAARPELEYQAASVLRDGETTIMPGEKVTHLNDEQLVDLLSRDAVRLV